MGRPILAKRSLRIAPPVHGLTLVDVRKVPRDLLVQQELKYTGLYRPNLWSKEHMFSRADVAGVALVSDVIVKTVNELKGWALVRRCPSGFRIGPLYADGPVVAKAVLMEAMKLGTPMAIERAPLPNVMEAWSTQRITDEATLVAEVWTGNFEAMQLFEELGWSNTGENYRMWLDGTATQEQQAGGSAQKGMYAIFDAAVG